MPGRVNFYTSRMRVNLDYLARKALGEDITNDGSGDDDNRIRDVKEILPLEMKSSFERFCYGMEGNEKHSYAQVLKMLATTAPTTSLIPAKYTGKIRSLLCNEELSFSRFNAAMADLRSIILFPEVKYLINHSATANEGKLPEDIK